MNTQIRKNAKQQEELPLSFRLAQPVEFVVGLNNIPMLYIPKQERYIRLSGPGKEILLLFQTGETVMKEEVVTSLASRFPQKQEEVVQKVEAFLVQLERLGILTPGDGGTARSSLQVPQRGKWAYSFLRLLGKHSTIRIPLWRPERVLAERLVKRVRANGISQMAKVFLWFWLSFAFLVTGFSLVRLGIFFDAGMISWPLLLLLLACHLAGHECSHILVGSYHRVKTRAIGLGLLYYFLPIMYVDRTDSYRLRDANASAAIALAGPAFDLSAATITAFLTAFLTGWLKANFHIFFLAEAIIFFSNSNPLMPGDGYQALESTLGGINFRQRSFQTLFALLTRAQLPAYLRRQSWKMKVLSCLYSLLALAWIGLMFWFILAFLRGEIH